MDNLKRDMAVLKAMCGILLVVTLLTAIGQLAMVVKMTEVTAQLAAAMT